MQVKGVRSSVESAIAIKQSNAEISDSIVAEDIGKLPDNSVAAALQRVTGVQVARAGGEVGQVLVRGLPNVITTLDGRNVFTTVGRDMELADVPAELLHSVEVYKTTGAQFQEGGIAGVVDVHLRRPFDFDQDSTIAGSVSALRGDQSGKTVPDGSLTISQRRDTAMGRMGWMGERVLSTPSVSGIQHVVWHLRCEAEPARSGPADLRALQRRGIDGARRSQAQVGEFFVSMGAERQQRGVFRHAVHRLRQPAPSELLVAIPGAGDAREHRIGRSAAGQ
ncbi:TonB-dependent receptor plug domain-containing protein [Xanthomonas phaseoli]|uniref:TonB-dependent receptor plug domain-containing protein n=1 Tax=Xanthomonas phaseoli TaxID=1985254 RepID=UPI001FFD2E17|nr:TonB-dependent receptor plug domain-containing protein [Xanthomonas phaseoli]